MINPQLTEYINQQRASGTTDEQLKKIILESGWSAEDVEEHFGPIKSETQAVYTAKPETPVQVTENKPEPVKSEYVNPFFEEEEKHKSNPLIIIFIIAILAGILGIGTWLIFKKSASKTIINPTNVTVNISPSTVPQKLNSYINSTYGFSINPPDGWKTEENGPTGVIVNILNPVTDSDNGNKFATNINIVSENTGNMSLDNYVISSKKVLNESFSNYNIISENKTDIGGKQGILLESQYQMGVYQLHNLQMFIIYQNKSFVITATTLNSVWNNYKDEFTKSIMSFELK